MKFKIEVVWNREFDFVSYGSPQDNLDRAIAVAKTLENSGDGQGVKKTRIVDENRKIVWQYGQKINQNEQRQQVRAGVP